jgi:hypothetical protein
VEAGRPLVPAIVVDGKTMPLLHVSQLAAALGLAAPDPSPASRLALQTVPILESWLHSVRTLDFELLTAPTASRGRSLRNLTVNVFHPFELMPAAWDTSAFPWDPERDDEREALLTSTADVAAFAERALIEWTGFVRAEGSALDARDPLVSTPRGEVSFSALVDSQLRHAQFHHDQLGELIRDRADAR